MRQITVLTPQQPIELEGCFVDDSVLVDRSSLSDVLGWELKPQGLCRDAECVPVTIDDLVYEDSVDLGAAAKAVGVESVLAQDAGLVALSVPSSTRSEALRGRCAPEFSLPDLAGEDHSLEQFAGRKRLLVAFASW